MSLNDEVLISSFVYLSLDVNLFENTNPVRRVENRTFNLISQRAAETTCMTK